MAYFRTKQGGDVAVNLPLGTTSAGATASLPNYGISIIVSSSADTYVLQPPVAGVEKTLVFNQYSTATFPIVKLSSNASAAPVSLMGVSTNLTVFKSAAGKSTVLATVIQMKGISSTQWLVTNMWPSIGALTTGSTAVNSGIALSST